LDYIRNSNVVSGESGGITQHIGAHRVELKDGKSVTFLDTPGHEAFTAMRARGAQVTDMVVLVVAANDGVMPQTIEAIDHAKAAGVPLIIAINKMDLPDIDPEKVKRELSERNVLVEDWGGKIQAIPISAKTGMGVDDLLASMHIEAEMLELKANVDTLARGTVIDSKLDKGHGPIATVLIQKGTLKVGNPFICNNVYGKVRAMMNERGQRIKEAGPSVPVQILGFDQVPQSADIFAVVENEREIKRIASERQRLKREIDHKKISAQSLDAMSALIKEGAIKNLPIIIKGDVDGSIEAISEQLSKIANDEVGVQVIHKAVGMISESDVLLASASNAIIIGFHVQVSSNAKLQAQQEGVDIRTYKVIYNAVEEITLALEGMLEPEKVEEILGRAVVQEAFKIPKIGVIAGSRVSEGKIVRNGKARVIREEEEIASGEITSLRHLKDDVKEIRDGFECGIGIDNFSKFKEGDIIVCYEIKSVKRTLVLT
jgi:translation initiation factor IF-2